MRPQATTHPSAAAAALPELHGVECRPVSMQAVAVASCQTRGHVKALLCNHSLSFLRLLTPSAAPMTIPQHNTSCRFSLPSKHPCLDPAREVNAAHFFHPADGRNCTFATGAFSHARISRFHFKRLPSLAGVRFPDIAHPENARKGTAPSASAAGAPRHALHITTHSFSGPKPPSLLFLNMRVRVRSSKCYQEILTPAEQPQHAFGSQRNDIAVELPAPVLMSHNMCIEVV